MLRVFHQSVRRAHNVAHVCRFLMPHSAQHPSDQRQNTNSVIELIPVGFKYNRQKESNTRYGTVYLLSLSLFGFWKKSDDATKDEEPVDEMVWELKKAKHSEHKKEYKEALLQYHNALAMLQDRAKSKEWNETQVLEAQVFIYDNLANLSMAMGLLDQSEKLFKETLKGFLQMGNPTHTNAAVEISLKLAMIYAMQNRYEESETGYNFCIDTMKSIIKERRDSDQQVDNDTLALLGMCYNSFSRFLYLRKRPKEAEDMLHEGLKLAKDSLGKDHPQIVTIQNDLAAFAASNGNLETAKDYSIEAVRLARQNSEEDLPVTLCNLGTIYLKLHEYTKAKAYCQDALKVARNKNNKEVEREANTCLGDITKFTKNKS